MTRFQVSLEFTLEEANLADAQWATRDVVKFIKEKTDGTKVAYHVTALSPPRDPHTLDIPFPSPSASQ